MSVTGRAEIEWNKVPEVQQTIVCRAINDGVDRFYKDPKSLAAFDAWYPEYLAKKEKMAKAL